MRQKQKRRRGLVFLLGLLLMAVFIFLGNKAVINTSTDDYCESCHVHPHSTQSWKKSTHYINGSGIRVHCVECHLPPHGEGYLPEKARTGIRDVWANWFKDSADMNWEAKSQIEYATSHTFETSCIRCHQNNFPPGLSKEGRDAHLYYDRKKGEDLQCINCHITVGHYDPTRQHAKNTDFGIDETVPEEIYTEAAEIVGFEDFTETIPGSAVSFEMLAIPGGSFTIGSPEDETGRDNDEGPGKSINISPFFMAKTEVSWAAYMSFFKQTGAQGKTADAYLNKDLEVDGISGPTPPWGAPDQGWGLGEMPAITMSHHAAEVFCLWLTEITGKKYRLPTEAEWEYAARGGSSSPYFFEGDPRKYIRQGLWNKLFGVDTSVIASHVVYAENSFARPEKPSQSAENPFGLVNMLGNVAEFCSDWYAPDAYAAYDDGSTDPTGPASGTQHVIRGGSYMDGADLVRCASRDSTSKTAWLKTDPQIPKSIWWYSDCKHVGFRVICEY